jgi:CO dehydrogenase/acetyl-CoA synthase beta subunit
MSELEELDLLIEHRRLTAAFLDAKAAYQADPNDPELRAAKLATGEALRTHRAHWRGIRDWIKATDPDRLAEGIAFPATVNVTSGVNK